MKPNVSVLLMWKWPLTATASMTQPATFSPTTVSAIAPARPHSCGVSPSRMLASRARGSAIRPPSCRGHRISLGLTAIYLQQRTAGSCEAMVTAVAPGSGPLRRPGRPGRRRRLTPACCSWIRRLIRASIAAIPRSRSGLTRSDRPSWVVNSAGVARISSALSPSSPVARMPAKPRVVGCFLRGVEEQVRGAVVAHLDRQEQRRLALRHRLQQVAVLRVAGRERRQLVGELQQQLQLLLARDRGELVDDVLQPGVERGGHGLSPWVMGTRTLLPHSVQDPS